MATLPDWMIARLAESPRPTWAARLPCGGLEERPVPDPGPLVEPFDPALVGPASLDMRIGRVFESDGPMEAWWLRSGIRAGQAGPGWPTPGGNRRVDGAGRPELGIEVVLEPGQTVICVSAEYYRLPPDVEGELYTKSSAARAGINHSTASMIHPGFHGAVAFELVNLGRNPRAVRTGARLVQIKFTRLEAPAAVPYFAQPGAKYLGQVDRVESADPEGSS